MPKRAWKHRGRRLWACASASLRAGGAGNEGAGLGTSAVDRVGELGMIYSEKMRGAGGLGGA
jgi:hypothetical protein